MTPEGRVKADVDWTLNRCPKVLWYFKPVQQGFGKPALDYICCVAGRFVAIETKRPGQNLTPFQRQTAVAMLNAGAAVWIISTFATVENFGRWLAKQ